MPNHVSIGANSVNKELPQGAFTAFYVVDGKQITSKRVAIHLHGEDLAFEMVEDWAQNTAKENDCEIKPINKTVLLQRIRSNSARKTNNIKQPSTNEGNVIWDAWNNKKFAHLFITNGVKNHGVKIVQERLLYLNEYFKEVADKEIKLQIKQDEADILHANAIYDVFVKTGIDMLPSINSEEVKELYIALKLKGEK